MDRRAMFTRAFDLAYLIIRRKRESFQVAEQALRMAPAKIERQDYRRYYDPVRVGDPQLNEKEILLPRALGTLLLTDKRSLAQHVRKYLRKDTKYLIDNPQDQPGYILGLQNKLARDINDAITDADLFGYFETENKYLNKVLQHHRKSGDINKSNRLILQYAYQGHFASPVRRNFINHTETQKVQLAIFELCDRLERKFEQNGEVTCEDVTISFLKHLARLGYNANSFYTVGAFCMLIHNYGRKRARLIYATVMQGDDQQKRDQNFSNLKKNLMDKVMGEDPKKCRFGLFHKLHVSVCQDGSPHFIADKECSTLAKKAGEWINRLSLWMDENCVSVFKHTPEEAEYPTVPKFLFTGNNPDDEHPVEQRRIHALSHQDCLEEITDALGFPPPEELLMLPLITSAIPFKDDSRNGDRLQPPTPDPGEMDEAIERLELEDKLRASKPVGNIKVSVNGNIYASFDPNLDARRSFTVSDTGCFLTISTECEASPYGEVILLSHPLTAEFDEGSAEEFILKLGNGRVLRFEVEYDPNEQVFLIDLECKLKPETMSVLARIHRWLSSYDPRILIPVTAGMAAAVLFVAINFTWLFSGLKSMIFPVENDSLDARVVKQPQVRSPEESETKLEIIDSPGKITVKGPDQISGIEDYSEQIRSVVANAVWNRHLQLPDTGGLVVKYDPVMGDNRTPNEKRIQALSPKAEIIRYKRITFKWKPAQGFQAYIVRIYDDEKSHYDPVIESEPIAGTSWSLEDSAQGRLERGHTYMWYVDALSANIDGQGQKPQSGTGKFKLLDKSSYDRLAQAEQIQPRSHLVMGILYAEAGLPGDAERELKQVVNENRESDIAKQLLAMVQKWKRR